MAGTRHSAAQLPVYHPGRVRFYNLGGQLVRLGNENLLSALMIASHGQAKRTRKIRPAFAWTSLHKRAIHQIHA